MSRFFIPFLAASLCVAVVGEAAPAGAGGTGKDPFYELLNDLGKEVGEANQLQDMKTDMLSLTNANEQQRSLTVFALGRLLSGDSDSAMWAKAELEKRYPKSRYLDAFRTENLTVPCDKCKGDGKRNEPCRGCHGSKICAACNGKGTIATLSKDKNTCPGCSGSGKCPICKGGGRQTVPCQFCAQRGRIYDDFTIRQTIDKLLKSEGPPASLSAAVAKAKSQKSAGSSSKKSSPGKKKGGNQQHKKK